MLPNPGPTLDIAEAEAENAVKKSSPKKLRIIAAKTKINIYKILDKLFSVLENH